MRIISFILLLLIILLGVSFAGLNGQPVSINYYMGTSKMALSLLLAVVLGGGALLGILVGLPIYFRLKYANGRLRRRVKSVEKEVENLRVLPLKEAH